MTFYNVCAADRLADILEASKLIKPDDLADERDVANLKWFRYRFMSPLAATRHFAKLYTAGLRAHVRRHYDAQLAERVSGLSANIFSGPSGSLTQLWQARQRADALGVPYELLIEFAFDFASRRKWRKPPRPIQLFGTKNSDLAWRAEFEKFKRERYPDALMRLCDLPQYRIEKYRGLTAQNDLRLALNALISERPEKWASVIRRYCIETRHLPLLPIMRRVPAELRKGVISDVRHDREHSPIEPAPVESLREIAFVPSCFGIPAAHDPGCEHCTFCPFNERCGRLARDAREKLLKAHGTISPVKHDADEKRRKADRERQRAHRLRKGEAKAAATPTM